MAINKNVTFRRKHRPIWYGMLCLVMITAAVAVVGLYPMQIDDALTTEDEHYILLDSDKNVILEKENFGDIVKEINSNTSVSGKNFTIIVNGNVADFLVYTLSLGAGNNVTLTSSSSDPFILTKTTVGRHFTVNSGTLTLDNIILEGGGAANVSKTDPDKNTSFGGIEVKASGTLVMNDGAVIRDCIGISAGGVHNYGTFIMNGGEISGNAAKHYGGGLYSYGGTATMIGGKICGNTADSGGGASVANNGTFTIYGGEISNNNANNYGGGVYINSTFEMNGGEISYNNTNKYYGGGVYNSSGTFTMNDGEITDNTSSMGGGVYNAYGGKFTMEGGEISLNEAGHGGGVFNDGSSNRSTFTMNGGLISENKASSSGGGVDNYGTFTMNGGLISENKASSNGGGVFNTSGGTFTMNKGEISDKNSASNGGGVYNSATFVMNSEAVISNNNATGDGGGVYNSNSSTITICATIDGGEISSNTAKRGGGVFNDGEFIMIGGAVISNNTATTGGGLFNFNHGTITITSGTIAGNTAVGTDNKGSGGGIYTVNYGKLIVGDGVVFSDNVVPTVRMRDLAYKADRDGSKVSDLEEYNNNISTKVVLDDLFSERHNAPAYNNQDINYPEDTTNEISAYIEGSGWVSFKYGPDRQIKADVDFDIPIITESATLTAIPDEGNKFTKFIINDRLEIFESPYEIPITGNMKIVTVFSPLPMSPSEYVITATADDGSIITPEGDVKVPDGGEMNFTFSPKPGYRITAVLVDGEAISPADLEAGEYTFFDVKDNHTIHVESEIDDGNENGGTGTGSGGNGGTGTGPGGNGGTGTGPGGNGGTGTGPGGDVGTGTGPGGDVGTGPGGNETGSEGNDGTGSARSGEWAVLNMVCAALAILTGLIAFIAGSGRSEGNIEKKKLKTSFVLRTLALIIGIVSVVVFLLTEERSLSAVPTDGLTPLMFVLFLAALILTMVSIRFDEGHEGDFGGE